MKDSKILDDHFSLDKSIKRKDTLRQEFEPDAYSHLMSVYSWEKAEYYLKAFEKNGINILLKERSTPNFTRVDLTVPPEQFEQATLELGNIKANTPHYQFNDRRFQIIAVVFSVIVLLILNSILG